MIVRLRRRICWRCSSGLPGSSRCTRRNWPCRSSNSRSCCHTPSARSRKSARICPLSTPSPTRRRCRTCRSRCHPIARRRSPSCTASGSLDTGSFRSYSFGRSCRRFRIAHSFPGRFVRSRSRRRSSSRSGNRNSPRCTFCQGCTRCRTCRNSGRQFGRWCIDRSSSQVLPRTSKHLPRMRCRPRTPYCSCRNVDCRCPRRRNRCRIGRGHSRTSRLRRPLPRSNCCLN